MSGFENNLSTLHRSRSATSVKHRKKHPVPSTPLDPGTSRIHALIAAHRAMDRSQSRSSGDIGRSESNASHRSEPTATKTQHVRFSPATQLRRQRSAFQSKSPHLSAALRSPLESRIDGDPYVEALVSDLVTSTENYGSEPSSYRRIRRARSMLTPRRQLFSNPSSPNHTPFSQAPTLRTATSSTNLTQAGLGLRIKRSLTFLRPVGRMDIPPRSDTHMSHQDEAIRLARTQFLDGAEDKKVQKKSSRLFIPKARNPQKAFRRSVRSSQLTGTDDSMTSNSPGTQSPKPVQTKRSFSASLRDRMFRAFGRTASSMPTLPPQQLEATRQHFGEVDDTVPGSGFDNYHIEQDEDRRESFYVPSRPDEYPDEERDRFSPTLHTAGSRESLHSNARSRVTSWSNSTMTTSTARGSGLERNRLSIIKEDGGPHQPSCSAGRHIGGISLFQEPPETENEGNQPFPPVDSQRIYSALMKRIREEEAEIEHTQSALEEVSQRRYGACDPLTAGKSTIRAVSNTTIGTEATEQNFNHDIHDEQLQQHQGLTPAMHRQNLERRRAKLVSQEEQSSFYPFSDQGKPQTPSPFRKLLEQRRSENEYQGTSDGPVIDEQNRSRKLEPPNLARGRFGMSSESIYSQTTDGGENPNYIPPIGSSEELATILQEVDEDTGMATIIPARYRFSERPMLPSEDSSERREWKGWIKGEMDASLGRRDNTKTGIHFREHAQINPDDVHLGKGDMARPNSKASTAQRFHLLDLKEAPRNTPAPKRCSSLTKSQSGLLLKRASDIDLKISAERNEETQKIGNSIRKLSPGNIANILKEKKSQILMLKSEDTGKENKPVCGTDSPRSSSPPVSTPGRLGLQMRSGNGRLRKRASDMTVHPGQKHQITPKNICTPINPKTQAFEESPTNRIKQSLSARLSRPFNMDVPEPNRPFDSTYLGKQDFTVGTGRLSTAPNASAKRPKGYGGLGLNPFDVESDETALPEIRTFRYTGSEGRAGNKKGTAKGLWSSKRMVSDFLRRRHGRSSSGEVIDEERSEKEG